MDSSPLLAQARAAVDEQRNWGAPAACRTGVAPVALTSLIDTTLVTLLAVEDLHGTWDETLELGD